MKKGKATREKWCEEETKSLCCYLCASQLSCDISCFYLGKPQFSVNVEQNLTYRLRAEVLEMISKEAKMNFPITESDCPLEERREINAAVQMLLRREANLQSIHEIERRLALKQLAPDSMRKLWSNQISELENQNWQIVVDVRKKAAELADSIGKHVLTVHHIDFQGLIDALKNKGIVLERLECPRCGGLLQVSEVPKKEEMLQCKYCGSSILAMNLYEKFKEILKT